MNPSRFIIIFHIFRDHFGDWDKPTETYKIVCLGKSCKIISPIK